MQRIVLVIILMLSSTLMARVTISGTGYIPRSLADDQLFVDLTFRGLTQESSTLVQDVRIFIKEYDLNVPLNYVNADQQGNSAFSYLENQTQETVLENNNTYTTQIFLRIDGQSGELADLMESRSSLILNIEYEGADNVSISIARDTSVANEAPIVTGMRGSHLKVIADITPKSLIAFTSGSKAGSAVKMYVAERNTGVITLPMLVYNASAASDTEESVCEWDTAAADGSSCLTCTAAQSYIRNSDLGDVGVQHSTAKFGASSISLTGLADKNDDGSELEYIAFLTYEPNGLQRSLCYHAKPQANQSWTESVDEDMSSKVGDPNCFVATAVGSSHASLDVLRSFRDETLMQNVVGRRFVAFYYSYGPTMAAYIEDKPALKAAVAWSIEELVVPVLR